VSISLGIVAIVALALAVGVLTLHERPKSSNTVMLSGSKPKWLRFERGARGYLIPLGHPASPDATVEVCNTPEEWVHAVGWPSGCTLRKTGQVVMIRKTGLMAMVDEPEPIQVVGSGWRGVVAQGNVVPIILAGTYIDCSGSDGPTDLYTGYDEPAQLDGNVTLKTTATERASEAGVVDVVVVDGDGRGKRGGFDFIEALDCKIGGALPEFDDRDVEDLGS
jgi:hypothetical protein